MDLSGVGQMMGAVPGGFQQGQLAGNQIDQGQLQIANERAKQVGMQAYYRALQGMFAPQTGAPGQTPQPGQPSVSMAQHAMPGPSMGSPAPQQPPMPQSPMPPAAPAGGAMPQATGTTPAGPPGGGQPPSLPSSGGQQISWQGIVQSLKQQNPGASDLELAHAVDHFMPMMTMQNKLEWQQMRNELMWEMTKMRTDTATRGQDVRADTTNRRTDVIGDQETGRQGRFETSEERRNRALDQRGEQFKQREDRLERGLQLRSDQGWQRLQQAKDQAQQRIQQGDRRQAVIDWRAAVDAQHKMAMEKIQATSTMNTMKPADREKLLKDQNEWYRGEIEKLKNLTTQRGNITDQGTPSGQSTTDVPAGQPLPGAKPAAPAASAAPGAPQQGDVQDGYRFKGGDPASQQSWEKVSMSDEQPDAVRGGQQYAAMAPRPPLGEASGRGGGGGFSRTPAAANESKGFEGLPKDYADVQNTLTQWARGKISPRDVKAALEKRGWSMDRYELRRSNSPDIEVFAPDGTAHYISP